MINRGAFMKRKLIAVVLSVVLTVALTACGKTEGDVKKPYGYRKYFYNTETGVKLLRAEYENLGTERTLTKYRGDEGEEEVESIEK